MAKEKQKMTLNVRKRIASGSSAAPKKVDPNKIAAFASGVEQSQPSSFSAAPEGKSAEQKVVRDAFTMPAEDHRLFSKIQTRCLSLGIAVNKSEIIRAGLKYITGLDDKKLKQIIGDVPKLKTGRPKVIG